MVKRFIKVGLVLLLSGIYLSASAALNLELTQGVSATLPIAMIPFSNGQPTAVAGNTTLQAVIQNDLQNSGKIRVKTAGVLTHKPISVQQLNFKYWRKQGVNDVLMASVTRVGGGQYQVAIQLVSLYSGSLAAVKKDPSSAVLLTQSFRAKQSGLRQLAHHISDVVFQKLTGIRGVFSTKIAYVLVQRWPNKAPRYALEVAAEDGFNPQALLVSSQPIMSPTWAPDGRSLAYVSFEKGHAAIFIQNVATGKRQAVSQFPGINGAPAFSPDGSKLALVLTRTGNPKVYVLNLATRQLSAITHGYSIDTEPAWAPDGQSLLFTSNRGGTPQLYRYTFANKQVSRLTFQGNYNARGIFLPSGQGLVMMHRETGMFGIAEQNLTTGQLNVLTQSGSDESPSLAPNGKMVLYAMQYAGRGALAVVSIDGRIKLRLPSRQGSVQEPAWSPFLTP